MALGRRTGVGGRLEHGARGRGDAKRCRCSETGPPKEVESNLLNLAFPVVSSKKRTQEVERESSVMVSFFFLVFVGFFPRVYVAGAYFVGLRLFVRTAHCPTILSSLYGLDKHCFTYFFWFFLGFC